MWGGGRVRKEEHCVPRVSVCVCTRDSQKGMDGGQAGITEDPYISSSKAGDSSGGKEARNN